MALVAEGLTNDEIAERLFVSPATAKTHVNRAMTKLGAATGPNWWSRPTSRAWCARAGSTDSAALHPTAQRWRSTGSC